MQGFSFSKELEAECIACFADENGVALTPKQAQHALSSLAGLFLAFAEDGRVAPAACAAEPAPDLLTT